MKRLFPLWLCVIVYAFPSAVFAFKYEYIDLLKPYIGIEAQMHHSAFQQNFGGNVFEKYHPQGNIFCGIQFLDYLGLEAGYKISVTKTRISSLGGNETAVGVPVTFPPALHRGTTSFKGWHAEILGFIPVYRQDCFVFLTTLGVTQAKLFARDKLIQNGRGIAPPTAFTDNTAVRTFNKKKTLLTAGIGIQFAVDERTFCRAKINWENFASFKSIIAQERADAILKPKNNLVYSLGFIFKFF